MRTTAQLETRIMGSQGEHVLSHRTVFESGLGVAYDTDLTSFCRLDFGALAVLASRGAFRTGIRVDLS